MPHSCPTGARLLPPCCIAGAILCAILGATRPAAAQDTTKTPADTSNKSATLAAVVVTATRAPTTLSQMSLHTTVITQQQIQTSPARTLDQLLRNISGVNMSGTPFYATDPTGQQTRMRGVTNAKVLVMVDGIPIHDPFYSTTQWFKVPLSSIQRVEIVRGGNSSLWGSLAVAGVINIITKKPVDDSGVLDLSYQSLNTTTVAASKNWLFSNGLGVRVSGDLMNTDGYQTTPEAYLDAVPGKSASSATNGNIAIAAYYQPAPDLEAFLRAGYHRQDQDVGGYRYGTNLQKSPDAAAGVTKYLGANTRADVRLWTQFVGFDKYNGAGCFLGAPGSCTTGATTAPLVQYVNSHDYNPYHELGGSALISRENLSPVLTSLQTGVDYRLVGGEDDATTYNKPTDTDPTSASVNRTNFGKGTQQFIGVFAQLTAAPAPKLDATLSARYDYWMNTNGVAEMTRYNDGTGGTPSGGAIGDSHKGSFNPSLSLRYQADSNLSFRGAIYRSFRAPGLNNLYRSYSSPTFISIANPNLSPETLTGGELGADLRIHSVVVGATYFRYDTKSLIATYKITDPESAPAEVIAICGPTLANCPATINFNTNDQNGRSQGLELTGTWTVVPALTLNGSYTYTDSHYTFTTTGDPVGAQLGGVPKHLVLLGADWTITSRWSATGTVRRSGSMFLDVNHTIPQPAFTLLGLSTSYRLTSRVDVYATGSNLTDVTYSDNPTTSASSETLGMVRSISGGVRIRF